MADDFYNRKVQTQIARGVLTFLLPVFGVGVTVVGSTVLFYRPDQWLLVVPGLVLVLFIGPIWLAVRKGYIRQGAALLVAALAVGLTTGMYFNGGVTAPFFAAVLALCALVAWLYPARVAIVFGAAIATVGGGFVWLAKGDYLPQSTPIDPLLIWIFMTIVLVLLLVVAIIPNRMLHRSLHTGEEKTKILAENEARLSVFQSAMEASPIAIGMATPEGKHWYQNKAFDDLFGDIGNDPPATIYVDKAVGREVFHTIMQGKTWNGDVQMYGRDGDIRAINLRAYALTDAAGQILTLIGVHSDITERLRLEEAMIQSEKMMSVGGLAAGMAHEINNPLAGMMQSANVISHRLDSDQENNKKTATEAGTDMAAIEKYMALKDIPRMLEMITRSGIQAAEIVTNMLSFSRKADDSFVPCDLAFLLNQTINLVGSDYDLNKKFDFRAIEIVREFQDDTPAVQCEAGKIQQVLFNILRNGAEAMHDARAEGTGTKHSKFVLRLGHEPEEDMVRIEISDNGPGMDGETCKRVFEPFFTTKDVDSGTGLGLSVSYFIIRENHGGELSVESTPGNGATFIIRLPVTHKSPLH